MHNDPDITELERVLGRLAMGNIIERRQRGHQKVRELRRYLELLTALEIAEDKAA